MEQVGCHNCSEWVTDELRPENVTPRYDKPVHFVTTQWTSSQTWYVAYKCIIALGMLGWILFDYYYETLVFYTPRYGLWFVFATDLAFLGLWLTTMFHAALIVWYHAARRQHLQQANEGEHEEKRRCCSSGEVDENSQTTPACYKLFWVSYTICAGNAFVISFSYWAFLLALSKERVFVTPVSKVKHSLNSGLILINLLLDGVPVRLLHVVYPVVSGLLYGVFTVVYYAAGGRGPGWEESIYPVLTWQHPGEAFVTIGLELLLFILMHTIIYGLYRLRLLLQACCGVTKSSDCNRAMATDEQHHEQRVLIDECSGSSQTYDSLQDYHAPVAASSPLPLLNVAK